MNDAYYKVQRVAVYSHNLEIQIMSHSTVHAITAFDSRKSEPLSDQRLAKVIYKTPRKGSADAKKQSVCASIPILTSHDLTPKQLEKFYPHITQLIHSAQDSILKMRVEELASSGSQATEISDHHLSIDACIAFLDDDAKGNRLTKEIIAEWFAANLEEMLTVALADRLCFPSELSEVQSRKLDAMVAVYSESFQSLAGGKTAYVKEKAEKLLKALELASADPITEKMNVRLQKMLTVEETADLFGL